MNSHFIKDIEIIDFKCFKDFKLDGFKRINLISGKNNIGKTAFMEACYVNVSSINNLSMATAIRNIKFMRENINLLSNNLVYSEESYLESVKTYDVISNIRNSKFNVLEEDVKKEYFFNINKNETITNSKEFNFATKYIAEVEYIDNFGFTDNQLAEAYETVQKIDKEKELDNLIKNFDENIESFKVIGEKPQCKVNGEYRDLVDFGDGLKHYISIICALYASSNGQLFIDEVDNGIHYTQIKNIWKLIFDISKKVNCQVFATTHSKECIEAFNEANEADDGVYLEFYRNKKTDKITVKQRDNEQLDYALSHNGEIRGE